MTIRTVLIANRGEIARRIIRTARGMGLRTVAVYSEADRMAPHVLEADDAFCIGPPEAAKSYLDGAGIIAAALSAGADAVHPGYGFLAENADFAESCRAAGLRFVGPSPEVIRVMGSKIEAKRRAVEVGLPVVPGYDGADQSDATLCAEAARIGFPVLIKASAGGGGRGMRVIDCAQDMPAGLAAARAEAVAGFGDPALLLERFVARARHVEVQILGDDHGSVVHLFERDCSLQRNHQKVVEEAPAPGLSADLRHDILTSAVRLGQAIGYRNTGTVEFLLDEEAGAFFFLEMNTRLQVEHPVTEAITGRDLVACQLQVAAGLPLGFAQEDVVCEGWAIEARVAAEDPARHYRPETGEITAFVAPVACRTDSGVTTGSRVTHHYDSMLAKVIAHAADRRQAIGRLAGGLRDMRLDGVGSNLGFLVDLLEAPDFADGRHDTGTIDRLFPDGWHAPPVTDRLAAAAVLARYLSVCPDPAGHPGAASPWQALGAWRAGAARRGASILYLEGEPVTLRETGAGWEVALAPDRCQGFAHVDMQGGRLRFEQDGRRFDLGCTVEGAEVRMGQGAGGQRIRVETGEETLLTQADARPGMSNEIRAPMPGLLVEVLHAPGTRLRAGDPVIVIEAMKLVQSLVAPCDGVLGDVAFRPGDTIEKQSLLARIIPEEAPK